MENKKQNKQQDIKDAQQEIIKFFEKLAMEIQKMNEKIAMLEKVVIYKSNTGYIN